MNKSAYILTFDAPFPIIGAFDARVLHQAIITEPEIISWWHYLKGTYIFIVKSNIMASDISQFVKPLMGRAPFLVMEVNLINHNGILTTDAWNWIQKQILESY